MLDHGKCCQTAVVIKALSQVCNYSTEKLLFICLLFLRTCCFLSCVSSLCSAIVCFFSFFSFFLLLFSISLPPFFLLCVCVCVCVWLWWWWWWRWRAYFAVHGDPFCHDILNTFPSKACCDQPALQWLKYMYTYMPVECLSVHTVPNQKEKSKKPGIKSYITKSRTLHHSRTTPKNIMHANNN